MRKGERKEGRERRGGGGIGVEEGIHKALHSGGSVSARGGERIRGRTGKHMQGVP